MIDGATVVLAFPQVNIAEDESEDSAVRRYMKQVMQSKVIDQLRARRRVESKIETHKRRLRERAEARKLGIIEPVWDELYGDDTEAKPFDEFFSRDDEELDIFEVGCGCRAYCIVAGQRSLCAYT